MNKSFIEVAESVLKENSEPDQSNMDYDSVAAELRAEIKLMGEWVRFYKKEASNKNTAYDNPLKKIDETRANIKRLEKALVNIIAAGETLGY